MNVVFDTTVLRRRYRLDSKQFEHLEKYARETSSTVFVPQIVVDETVGHLQRDAFYHFERERRLITKLNRISSARMRHNRSREHSVENRLTEYRGFLMKKLSKPPYRVVKYTELNLERVAERVIHRRKPVDDEGRGFADALIWETVLLIMTNQGDTIFVTDDKGDFLRKGQLHPDLQEEANKTSRKLEHFCDLYSLNKSRSPILLQIKLDAVQQSSALRKAIRLIQSDSKPIAEVLYARLLLDYDDISDFTCGISDITVDSFYVRERKAGQFDVIVRLSIEASCDFYYYDPLSYEMHGANVFEWTFEQAYATVSLSFRNGRFWFQSIDEVYVQ